MLQNEIWAGCNMVSVSAEKVDEVTSFTCLLFTNYKTYLDCRTSLAGVMSCMRDSKIYRRV
jgi:hypothetical protein